MFLAVFPFCVLFVCKVQGGKNAKLRASCLLQESSELFGASRRPGFLLNDFTISDAFSKSLPICYFGEKDLQTSQLRPLASSANQSMSRRVLVAGVGCTYFLLCNISSQSKYPCENKCGEKKRNVAEPLHFCLLKNCFPVV